MKKASAIAAILLTVIMISSACSGSAKIKSGTYVSAGTENSLSAGVVLENKNEFILYVDIFSYCPVGTYTVDGNTLTLSAADDEVYIFTIKGKELIFESGEWLEKSIDKGAVFKLENE